MAEIQEQFEQITQAGNIRSFRPRAQDMIRLGFWFTVGMAIVFPVIMIIAAMFVVAFGVSL